ncbi:MAG: NDP-sugar synthase [Acidobacteriota bacterium]|nr:NDP-sugar synthase [Acidobacteriota bacterium]
MGKPFPWPALVLTAGLATRLQPLSSVRAKAALPVAGEALVLRILRRLRRSGVTRVVLNLHHLADTITREVGDGSAIGLEARYSWEPEVLGSAGGPARALPLLEADRFLIVNGDTLADVDLEALAAQHVDTNAVVTMAVVDGDPRYNGIVADAAGLVRGFGRDPGAFHFIGIQAANASAFAGVSPDARSETVHGIYPAMIASRPDSLRVMRTTAEFFDIGTPQDYLDTARTIARREGRGLDRGHGCQVADDARIDSTILWNDVTVGAGATLTDCIVTDGVTVPAGARHDRCSLVATDRGMIATPFANA